MGDFWATISGIFADGKYDFLTDQETWGALQKQILKDQHADSTSCSPWKNWIPFLGHPFLSQPIFIFRMKEMQKNHLSTDRKSSYILDLKTRFSRSGKKNHPFHPTFVTFWVYGSNHVLVPMDLHNWNSAVFFSIRLIRLWIIWPMPKSQPKEGSWRTRFQHQFGSHDLGLMPIL